MDLFSISSEECAEEIARAPSSSIHQNKLATTLECIQCFWIALENAIWCLYTTQQFVFTSLKVTMSKEDKLIH